MEYEKEQFGELITEWQELNHESVTISEQIDFLNIIDYVNDIKTLISLQKA